MYSREEYIQGLIRISSEIFCEDGELNGKSPADLAEWIKENLK